ncbi:branched-chain amino acid ABC transporter substrate-binding protein [Prosthecomicrobium hirschii]|uniref:Branched-chain amino acid ABC transporter substrate-binding protein n=1 Tax=Prosthecodimorpha hirschii TaxID=665126 RepID=A0A0P6W7J0_9HYPH|nr:ABC transporter ATP-binding protein [Prosthecomicrobium hirschii]KPL54550.1 branched-chain amino acid ABC transporter substrate-binding protein [Prosthecomicrobium hirschii]
MADPILKLDDLSKNFGALPVTRHVSLEVLPGEIHAVIGPNGAGKTTLINQISGVLKPDRGRVLFAGQDVTRLGVAARARLGLARIFQISSVVAGFSAQENVALAAQAKAGSSFRFLKPARADRAIEDKAAESLAAVGLARRADVAAALLSHGEKRALELAMALVQAPRLVLLDEPMAGTGKAETERLTELLAGLRGRLPMLLIEHDMATVFALADRITVLVEGAVAASGSPEAIRNDPVVRRAYLGEDAHA